MDRTGTLFVITPDSSVYRNNLFYDEFRKGISLAANLASINVEFLFGFNQDLNLFQEAKGLVFSPDASIACLDLVSSIKNKFKIPIVQADNQVFSQEIAPPFDAFIGCDNFHGGLVTAQYLKSFFSPGSNLLVIAGNKELACLSYNQRLEGFLSGSNGHFKLIDTIYGDFNQRTVYNKLHTFLETNKTHPDLIFAFNDDSAIVARKVFLESGIDTMPLLAGFDGSSAGRVALSKKQIVCSYDQDPENLGRKAVRIFLDMNQDSSSTERINLIRGTLLNQNNIGNTFYAGVSNFLDRTLTPFSFRKRRYEIHHADHPRQRHLSTFRNELVCPIFFGSVKELPAKLAQIDADKFFILSDDNHSLEKDRKDLHDSLPKEGLKSFQLKFPGGENNKNPDTALKVIEELLNQKITKKSCLVLLGGGITGNLGGFVASILYRGIKFVHVPTTLMHMVDSSTGGKQAVDTEFGKNILGNFYEPEFIFSDLFFLKSLPERELRSGLAECIKHALCQDFEFYAYLLEQGNSIFSKCPSDEWQHIIKKTVRLKIDILEKDSYELNEGMTLVYGHTLGHALESASKYQLTHGESISIGMMAAAKISCALGISSPALIDEHKAILEAAGLPVSIPNYIEAQKVMDFLSYDKKYVDEPMTFVLLKQIGELHVNKGVVPCRVPDDLVRAVVDELYR